MLPFEKQFKGKLKEVFLYITYRCNLSCLHCYMSDKKRIDMPLGVFEPLLEKLVWLGASKVTFIGGEPTLHLALPQFIDIAKNLGIDYIRLDTNGQFQPELLELNSLKCLNDVCFSLDGVDALTHSKVRSASNYYSVTTNINKAVKIGYKVRVTMTVNSLNLSQVEEMVALLEDMGVSVLNLHLTSNNGMARNNKWLLVGENRWIKFYEQILPKLRKYNVEVKIPKRYIKANETSRNNGITCEAVKSTRIGVTPDCKIYACPLLFDKHRYFAYFRNGEFIYSKNYQNNVFLAGTVKGPVCPVLMQENHERYKRKKIIPLCVSYKQTNKD